MLSGITIEKNEFEWGGYYDAPPMVSIVHCPKLPFFPLGNWAIFLVFAVLFSKSAPMQVELAARILTRTVSQTSPAEGPLFTLVKYNGLLYFT